jgi:uncharacterized protein
MTVPIPRPDAVTRPFWEGCARGELRYQTCQRCGQVQMLPRSHCVACHDSALQWRCSAGIGRLLSYTMVYRAPNAALAQRVPYVIALVDMTEGFRLMVNLVCSDDACLALDAPVRITFRRHEDIVLPEGRIEGPEPA